MLHCIYNKSGNDLKSARLRYNSLLNAGYSVALHGMTDEDFKNFEKLKINPFAHAEEDWRFIIYDDQSGKFFVDGMEEMSPRDFPDYFRPRLERRLALELALERAYAFGV